MDFSLTREQIERRKEYFDVCKDLEKQEPPGLTNLDSICESQPTILIEAGQSKLVVRLKKLAESWQENGH